MRTERPRQGRDCGKVQTPLWGLGRPQWRRGWGRYVPSIRRLLEEELGTLCAQLLTIAVLDTLGQVPCSSAEAVFWAFWPKSVRFLVPGQIRRP